jgi:Tol biopolymer transport system component
MLASDGIYRSADADFTIKVISSETTTQTLKFAIENADPFPYLSSLSVPSLEGETATVNFSLDRKADTDLIFQYSIVDDSTTSADYDATSGHILFPAGETTARLEIPLTTNSVCSLSKRFYIQVTPPAASSQSPVRVEQQILENSPVTYSLNSTSLVEGSSGNLTLTSDLACPFDRVITLSSTDGTALAGTNYTAISSQSITLPAMATNVQVPVTTLNDSVQSPTKSFSVSVVSTSYGSAAGSGTVSILDNNTAPSLTWTATSSSAARSTGSKDIAWSLSAASGYTVTATIDLSGTAIQGTDYAVSSVTLSIPPGTTSGNFPVSLLTKNTYNGNQTVILNLTSLDHATVGARATHTLTITDTAPAISLSGPVKITEGSSASYTVSLDKASASDITVNYLAQDGSAQAGVDFDSLSGTLTIPAGQTSAPLAVQSLDNATACQADRSFSLVLSSPSGASLSVATATTAIEDDDYPNLSVADTSVTEGNTAVLTATLSQSCGFDVQFSWATANSTATAGKDYMTASGAVLIPAGTTSKTISVSTINNSIDQGNLGFYVNLSAPVKLNLSATSATVTILDDESAPQIIFDQSSATALESVGQYSIQVSLDHPTIQNVTAALSFSGTAIYGTDYTLSAASVSIATGALHTSLQINPIRGSGGKSLTLTLGSPSRGTLGSASSFTLDLESDPFTGPLIMSSSDSSRLLYLSSVGSAMPLGLGVPGSASGIRLSKAAASSPKVIDFAFTGDQSRAVFIANNQRAADLDLFSVRADGSSLVQLNATGWATGRGVKKMRPIGNGQRVIFLADRVSGGATADLYAVNADSSSLINLASAVTGTKTIFDFEVSPNGSKVVFTSDYQGSQEIYSVNPDGTGLVKINGSLGAGSYVDSFSIAPDSSKVVYTVKASGGHHVLYASPIGSGSMTLLNTVVSTRTVPSFKISPDSARVAYLQNATSATNFDLYSVSINGSSHVQINQNLVSGGKVVDYGFSPNSAKIYYLAEAQVLGSPELYIAAPDGTNRYRLSGALPSGGKITSASFTPNSAQMVYLGRQDSSNIQELYSVDLTGSNRVKLNLTPVSSGQISKYLITNDSSKVIYLGDQDIAGISEVYAVSINGSSRSRISPPFGAGKKADSIFLLPSNAKLLYRSNQNDGSRFDWFSMDLGGGNTTSLFAP